MTDIIHLHFTKGAEKYDRLIIERADGHREQIDCPKQRIIPHDMVHFAVESELTHLGFLSRVTRGETAAFEMAAEAESDGVERLVEVIQGDGWSGGESDAADLIALYRVTCEARQCPMLPVNAEDIDAIRTRVRALDARWSALAIGETMTLDFEAPTR